MSYFEAIWKSIILGTVQGLTEFLPVSSSGHLSFLQRVLGYDLSGGNMTFVNVMLHLGTLLAVVYAFRREIFALFKRPFKMLFMLIVATIPAGVVGVIAGNKIDAIFAGERGLLYLAICFCCTAAMLLVCEIVAKRRRKIHPFGWKNALSMGFMQAVALLPGISRSGSTIVAGTLSGAKGEDVARFSFLMSVPVILGSVVLELKDFIIPSAGSAVPALGGADLVGTLVGIFCAAVFGLLAIRLMLKVINRANYKWFAFYLFLLSLTCLWLDVMQIV